MPHSDHYVHVRKKKRLGAFDKLVVFISVVYPLSALPQAIAVLGGNVEGVSLISWVGFLICASLYLVYGIKYQVLPMLISNTLWVLMDGLVIIGIISGTML